MSKKKVKSVVLGPVDKPEADRLAKVYRADGYKVKVHERPSKPGRNREGQYMVECDLPG